MALADPPYRMTTTLRGDAPLRELPHSPPPGGPHEHQTAFIGLAPLTIAVAPTLALAQGDTPPSRSGSITELLRYEPTGLSLMSPYARGKIPVLFVHGLCATPASWHRMITTLEHDPAIRERYQFWTFGYSTRDPIPYSAHLLRRDLEDVHQKLDRAGRMRPLTRW